MDQKQYSIPVFIPNLACPNKCVFCNQSQITGIKTTPTEPEIKEIIESRLLTIPDNSDIEIAFFGGSFTGIPEEDQEHYLAMVQAYLNSGRVKGIRISTRPDCINEKVISILKKYNVTVIELGAQSMDDDVLSKSGRGHTREDIIGASKLIKDAGLVLGLQMMIGLPGDTRRKSIETAQKIIELGADCTRIYPTLVVKDTLLENLYNAGEYEPLTLEEAADWSADILEMFERAGVDIIRVGLHPSEGLLSGDSLVAGPFHTSFRELVYTQIWNNKFKTIINDPDRPSSNELQVHISPDELKYAVGYDSRNREMLKTRFKKVDFRKDQALRGREFNVHYC